MQEYNPEEYINPKDFIGDLLPNWVSLTVGNDQPVGKQLESLIKNFIYFDDDDYYQIATAYLMISQKWSKVVPILFSYGLPGSGKSTLSLIAAYLHNQEYTFSSSDTFPSIRNTLDFMRWLDDDKQYERDGAILCWDNLGADTLRRDPRLYQLLLFGYNRNTDKVMIANTDGTNKVFHVFCPKIISSVEPLHLDPEFSELQRRLLLLHHKKIDGIENIAIDSINDYDFSGFPGLFFDFWHNRNNCLSYVAFRNSASRRKWKISESQKTISTDLAAVHALIYGFTDASKSIELIENYWSKLMQQETQSVIEILMEEWLVTRFKELEVMHINYLPLAELEIHLDTLEKSKQITFQEKKDAHKVIRKLGYKRTKYGWCKI